MTATYAPSWREPFIGPMPYTGQLRASGSPWGAATGAVYAVLCSDGRLRHATVTAEADTFYTLPARVSVRGRTVTGHIYVNTLDYAEPVYQFSAYTYRRNAGLLPAWPTAEVTA